MEIKNFLCNIFFKKNIAYAESNSLFNIFKNTQNIKDEEDKKDYKDLNIETSINNPLTYPTTSTSTLDIENDSSKKNEDKIKENMSQYMNTFDSPNALLFENLNKEYKFITTQDNFDGFRFEVDKNVNKYLQSTHSLFLGTTLREIGYLYQFGANFTNHDNSLLMVSRINIDGSVNGRFSKKITSNMDCKFNFNTYVNKDTRNLYELSLEYNYPLYTYNIKTLWQSTWILNGSYTQLLTNHLQTGIDLTYILSNLTSIATFGLRYNYNHNVITLQMIRQPNFKSPQYILQQLHTYKIQYSKKISDRLSLATELELTPKTKESLFRIAWDYSFRHAKVQGIFDTSGKISVFTQDYSGLGISGFIDFLNNEYKFGFMMHITPQEHNQNHTI